MDEPTDTADDAPARNAAGLEWTGRLAQGIAHDLANLLMVVGARARFALGVLPPESEARAHLEDAAAAAAGAGALIRHLARTDVNRAWRPQLVDLNGVIASLEPVLATLFRNRAEVSVTASARQGVVYLDSSRLERTLLDLALDHSDAVPPAGAFSIATKTRELDDRIAGAFGGDAALPYALVTVSCPCPGDAAESLDRLLLHWMTPDEQPTVAWREQLSACAQLPHGAGYMLTEHANSECRMSVYVPPPSATGAPQMPPRPREHARLSRTVLVAEDQPTIRRLTTRALRGRGYAILEAGDGAAALALAAVHAAPIDVLVTDMDMPGMSGRELAKALRERYPNMLTVFLSGSDLGSVGGLDPAEAAGFLAKPFANAALVQMVATLLDSEPA